MKKRVLINPPPFLAHRRPLPPLNLIILTREAKIYWLSTPAQNISFSTQEMARNGQIAHTFYYGHLTH